MPATELEPDKLREIFAHKKNISLKTYILNNISVQTCIFQHFLVDASNIQLIFLEFMSILKQKYSISTALIREKPVRRPMVPPIADNMSTNLAALSLVILSNVGVSKYILTILKLFFHSYSKSSVRSILESNFPRSE